MQKHSYIKQLLTVFFLGLLSFPAATQYVHVFELHKHEVCVESNIHMHENLPDCELDDLRLPLFDEVVYFELEQPFDQQWELVSTFWQQSAITTTHFPSRGRAPPIG